MRSDQPAEAAVSFGPFRLYPSARLLERDGAAVHVGGRALDILIFLAERAGEIVSKKDLVARVWSDVTVDEGSLRFHVTGLRKALGDGKSGARYITNVPGRGYCLVAPVSPSSPQGSVGVRAQASDPPQTLPARLARMVGRDDTVQKIMEALSAHRFVSIVGPGGIGKTTVATAAGHALWPAFDGQVSFVDLGPLGEARLVPGVVASKLGLTIGADDPIAGLVALVRDKHLLLILDSCEHVIEPVAVLAETLFNAAPSVHILVTSRESLRVEGEYIHRLFPLPCPPDGVDVSAADVLGFPAAQLFVERVTAAAGEFELADADAPGVADICHRLDGIPLALELAAARADVFGIRELAARLDDRLLLTTRGRRTAMPRHQTLRATLDWSYELLDEDERALLRRLAIFAGSFSLEAATTVAASAEPAAAIVERLLALVAKSLVAPGGGGASLAGYRLLDTTRAYALEKLAESGEREQLARRHAEYFRGLFERAEAEWEQRPTSEQLSDYGRQIDNLRAAIDWAFSTDGDALIGIALTTAAVPLWMHLSLLEECRGRVEQAIDALAVAAIDDTRLAMKLHAALGASLAWVGGAVAEIELAWTRALHFAESLGDIDHQLRSLWGLWLLKDRDALPLAHRFFAVATTQADQLLGERMIAVSSHYLGDQNTARHHIERVVTNDVADDKGPRIIRFQIDQRLGARAFLARILWLQGFPEQAMHVVQSLVEHARAADHANSLCHATAIAGCPVALWTGNLDLAEHYIGLLHDYSARHALALWRAFGKAYRGVLLVKRGDISDGLALLHSGFDAFGAAFAGYRVLIFRGEQAAALGRAGRISDGLATVDEAINHAKRTAESWLDAELLRIKGELILLQAGDGAAREAEDCFRQSLELAGRQGALAWELRTATSFARMLRDRGRSDEALATLQPVYSRFTEGFETGDLKAAKALLDDLG